MGYCDVWKNINTNSIVVSITNRACILKHYTEIYQVTESECGSITSFTDFQKTTLFFTVLSYKFNGSGMGGTKP